MSDGFVDGVYSDLPSRVGQVWLDSGGSYASPATLLVLGPVERARARHSVSAAPTVYPVLILETGETDVWLAYDWSKDPEMRRLL